MESTARFFLFDTDFLMDMKRRKTECDETKVAIYFETFAYIFSGVTDRPFHSSGASKFF